MESYCGVDVSRTSISLFSHGVLGGGRGGGGGGGESQHDSDGLDSGGLGPLAPGRPDFTACFQSLVFFTFPPLLFFVSAICYAFYLARSKPALCDFEPNGFFFSNFFLHISS